MKIMPTKTKRIIGWTLTVLVGLFLISGNLNGVTLIINSMFSTGTSLSLAAIPLFVLLGELLFRSGSVKILFDAVDGLVGNIRARLYVVSILLSTLFGALSGSAMAVAIPGTG